MITRSRRNNGGCSGGTLSTKSRVQQVGIDCSSPSMLHIPRSDVQCGQSCDVMRPQNSQQNQTNHQNVSAQADSQRQLTNLGDKSQKRMKWTHEMNTLIMREYYRSTRLETNMTDYRNKIYLAFKSKYPELNVTEQRIADQRRYISKNNKISPIELQEIKEQVALQISLSETQELEIPLETVEIVTEIEQTVNNSENTDNSNATINRETAENELKRSFEQYKDFGIEFRPKLPKIRSGAKAKSTIKTVNELLQEYLEDDMSLSTINNITYCAAVAVSRLLGHKIELTSTTKPNPEKSIPKWQKRIETRIEGKRQVIGRLTQVINGNKSKRLNQSLRDIYRQLETKPGKPEFESIIRNHCDTMKQTVQALAQRIRRYKQQSERRKQNTMFYNNEKMFYRNQNKINGNNSNQTPQMKEMENYWKEIWSNPKDYRESEWIKEIEEENSEIPQMNSINVMKEDLAEALKKSHNWKSPGQDKIHNFWYKNFPTVHEPMAKAMDNIIKTGKIEKFLTTGITYLLPKSDNASEPSKYRPITCLTTMYKILTSIIASKIYNHLSNNNIIAEEQKGCIKYSMGCKEQLTIDNIVTIRARQKHRNLEMAYIDYKKAFDSVPHKWLIKVLKLYKIDNTLINTLENMMKNWNTKLCVNTTNGTEISPEIEINRGIFQGDSLSPLWFCLALNPLSSLLNKIKGINLKARNIKHNLTHLLYMDDLKLYAEKESDLNALIKTTERFSTDINMEFGLDKCAIMKLKRGVYSERTEYETQNGYIKALENGEIYKYLGIKQMHKSKITDVKNEIKKTLNQRVIKILKSQLNSNNKFKAINTWAIPVLTYSFGIIKWSKTELETIERHMRRQLTMFGLHHPRSSVARLCVSRKHGGRGLLNIVSLEAKQRELLRKYHQQKCNNSELHKITATLDDNYTPLNLSNTEHQIDIANEKERINTWASKELHGRYRAELSQTHVDEEMSTKWLKYAGLHGETEGFMMAIQDRVIPTRNHQKYIQKINIPTDKCRMCYMESETIEHILNGCKVLTNTEYLSRHNQVAKIIHQELAIRFGLVQEPLPYYRYEPQSVMENNKAKIYWDKEIRTDKTVAHNRPDILLVDKHQDKAYIIDIAVPLTHKLQDTHSEKRRKYTDLAYEINKMWRIGKVEIVPIILSSMAVIPKNLALSMESLEIRKTKIFEMQKAVILQSCRTVRKVLDLS